MPNPIYHQRPGETRQSSRLQGLLFGLILAFVLTLSTIDLASATTLTGTVTDAGKKPLPDALVRLQATGIATRTDRNGAFRLSFADTVTARHVTAWKVGFLNGGQPLVPGKSEYQIVLTAVSGEDNTLYPWEPSRTSKEGNGKGEHKACEACHPSLFPEWKQSAHAGSATNPLFLAVFNGKGPDGRSTGGPGYRLDFPRSLGNCTTCHIPALALNNPFNSDPNTAQGVAREGIFCDLCHKIEDTSVDTTGGHPGILSIRFKRPAPGQQLFFGPLDDVVAGPDTYGAVYKDSRYCAPCHNGTFWGIPAYSEFSEWAASSYARKEVSCQDCHMRLEGGARRFAIAQEGGMVRDPATISSHVVYGLNDEPFMKGSVALSATASPVGDALRVRVSVKNVTAGHHIPTGSPMRNMVLLVEATNADGRRLQQVKGEVVPDWGGKGPPGENNYAGLPGKGFAKILATLIEYPADRKLGRKFTEVHPAPYWRPTSLVSDNRIPANGTDSSEYLFQLPAKAGGAVTIRTRLIYRRTFKSWGDIERIKGKDLELAESVQSLTI